MGTVIVFPQIFGRPWVTPLFFLAEMFAGRWIKRVVLDENELVVVFDPPNFQPISLRRASFITGVRIGPLEIEMTGLNVDECGVTSEEVEWPVVPGMPILTFSVKAVDSSFVLTSPDVVFHTPYGDINVGGSVL